MAVMPLQPLHHRESAMEGEVSVDPRAAIAPGVLLLATPQSQIVIHAGVCIGMGAVLHAHQGTLVVEEGAILGAGVLVVGSGTIGARACIGPVSTLINYSVKSDTVVAPGSLLGDESRVVKTGKGAGTPKQETPKVQSTATEASIHSAIARNVAANPARATQTSSGANRSGGTKKQSPLQESRSLSRETPETSSTTVSGHQHLQRLMATLFPHRQQLETEVSASRRPETG